jgi:hypothetical protein
MTTLGDKVLGLHRALDDHGIPHAIGGAIALAYGVNQARATTDVDLNVFLSTDHVDEILEAMPAGVRVRAADAKALRRDGQVRLRWGDNPVDLFLSTVAFHDAAATRIREVPFEKSTIAVLSPTDLTVCKALYGRPKDWVDIEAMRDAGSIDAPEALRWVEKMLGADHPNSERLREIVTSPPVPPDDVDRLPHALRPRNGR